MHLETLDDRGNPQTDKFRRADSPYAQSDDDAAQKWPKRSIADTLLKKRTHTMGGASEQHTYDAESRTG